MKNLTEYIESGILELYVLGTISPEESAEVERMAVIYPEVQSEIINIQESLETFAGSHSKAPSPNIKPFLFAAIDYTERLQNGEPFTMAPVLSENSKITDFDSWLSRPDMQLTEDFEYVHAKILSFTPQVSTALLWVKGSTIPEVHKHEHEKFFILEGTCDVIVEDNIYKLKAGDYFAIPLHKSHVLKVTSTIPCKAILQRAAA